MENFYMICLKCGTKNIAIEADTDYVFDGESETLEYTGYINICCKDCGNTERVKFSD